VSCFVRAHVWWRDLTSGKTHTIKDIALRESNDERYVARILKLAFLGSDITAAILGNALFPARSWDRCCAVHWHDWPQFVREWSLDLLLRECAEITSVLWMANVRTTCASRHIKRKAPAVKFGVQKMLTSSRR